eukprot:766918-Hanusia_phi.AAC.4
MLDDGASEHDERFSVDGVHGDTRVLALKVLYALRAASGRWDSVASVCEGLAERAASEYKQDKEAICLLR